MTANKTSFACKPKVRKRASRRAALLGSVGLGAFTAFASPIATAQIESDSGFVGGPVWSWDEQATDLISVIQGNTVNLDLSGEGGVNRSGPIEFVALTPLPAGVTLSSNGLISGTIGAAPGNYFVEFQARRAGDNPSVPHEVQFAVSAPPIYDPVANDFSVTTAFQAPIEFDPRENVDLGADGELVNVTGFGVASHGFVTRNGNLITYTPPNGYHGSDSFTYTVTDEGTQTSTGTVSVTVEEQPYDPIARVDPVDVAFNALKSFNVMSNDDPGQDGELIFFQSHTQPSFGQLAHLGGGNFEYTPNTDYVGQDAFSYTIYDEGGETANGAVNITVNPPDNNAPVAGDDGNITIGIGGSGSISALANDQDADQNDTLVIDQVNGASISQGGTITTSIGGVITLNAGGVFFYDASGVEPTTQPGSDPLIDPNSGFEWPATDVFTYRVSDGRGGSDFATVTVALTPPSESTFIPTAVDDSIDVEYETAYSFDPLINDQIDGSGDLINVTSVTQGLHGTVSRNGNLVTYDPNDGYHGQDSFTYTITDEGGQTAVATVSVDVEQPPYDPIVRNDGVDVDFNTTASFNVLLNDEPAEDGELIFFQGHSQPLYGQLLHEGGGNFEYTPNTDYIGPDTFSYTVGDEGGQTAGGTVTIDVKPPENSIPVALDDDDVTIGIGGSGTISALANDQDADQNDTLVIDQVNGNPISQNGTATTIEGGVVTLNAGGVFFYDASGVEPRSQPGVDPLIDQNSGFDWPATDFFTYRVTDGRGGSAIATVTITLTPPSANTFIPTAVDDEIDVQYQTAFSFDPRQNDQMDGSGDEIYVTGVTQGSNGVVQILFDGQIEYTPNNGFSGADSFEYTITDEGGQTSTATVGVDVAAATIYSPVAVDDLVEAILNQQITFNPLTNDQVGLDEEGIQVTSVGAASDGTVQIVSGSQVRYTPNTGFIGTDSFSYEVTDAGGQKDSASISVEVTQSPPPPPPMVPVEVASYDYDALGRLVSAVYDDSEWISYCYDANGNRVVVEFGMGGDIAGCEAADTDPPVSESPPPPPPESPPPPPPSGQLVEGTTGNDSFTDEDGNQDYDGLVGWDRLYMAGVEADYVFSTASDGAGLVEHPDGEIDTLRNIENIDFMGDGASYGTFRYFGVADGTSAAEVVVGTSGADALTGLAGNDLLSPRGGDDWVDGGEGWDRVNLDGAEVDYSFNPYADGPIRATNNVTGETDVLQSIEQVWFFGEGNNYSIANILDASLSENAPDPSGNTSPPPPPPSNDSWVWTPAIGTVDAQIGTDFALDLANYGNDTEADSVSFVASGLPAGLALTGSQITGAPTEEGVFSVSVDATDAGSQVTVSTSFTLNVDPAATGGGLPSASLVVFEDDYINGSSEFKNGTSEVGLSQGGDPVFSGARSLKLNAGIWDQAGIRPNVSIDSTSQILRLRVYRANDGSDAGFRLRHGPSNTAINLGSSNSTHWRVAGQSGLADPGEIPPEAWHLVEVDLAGLGITSTLLAVNIVGNATGNDTYFFDQVEFAAEFSDGTASPPPPPPPPPTNLPWSWDANASLPDGEVGQGYSIDLSTLGSDQENDPVTFTVSSLPDGLVFSGSTISGQPTAEGSYTITAYATDSGSNTTATISFPLVIDPAPTTGGLPPATTAVFDDNYINGASEFEVGTSDVGLSSGGDPVFSGTHSLRLIAGIWDQAGIRPNLNIDSTNKILRLRIYRDAVESDAGFRLRHGPSNTAINLNGSNAAHWRVAGETGLSDPGEITPGQWRLLEVDLMALGITTNLLAVNIVGNATGNDTYFFDQVEFASEMSDGSS